jgi:transcriptional regulator with XRE-family HTH domain
MNQTTLAAAIPVSQSQMSKYLGGRRPMNLDELAGACDALGLDMAEVISEAKARADLH